jgi:hypothetical protein
MNKNEKLKQAAIEEVKDRYETVEDLQGDIKSADPVLYPAKGKITTNGARHLVTGGCFLCYNSQVEEWLKENGAELKADDDSYNWDLYVEIMGRTSYDLATGRIPWDGVYKPKKLETVYNGLTIKSTFKGDKKADWTGSPDNWNNHLITVRNNETKAAIAFDFWASIENPDIETEKELLWAFRCFVDDAISGEYDFSEFCGEFGYSDDSIKARKIWKACQRVNEKLKRIYDGDIYELINTMGEDGIE